MYKNSTVADALVLGEIEMSIYLNSILPYENWKETRNNLYFVDKTDMLNTLITFESDKDLKYVCVTRPRRFGKTTAANMIAAFFSCGVDSRKEFETLSISNSDKFDDYMNKMNVIYMDFSKVRLQPKTFKKDLETFEKTLQQEIRQQFGNIEFPEKGSLTEDLNRVTAFTPERVKFVFIIDEWDSVFHKSGLEAAEHQIYMDFLSELLKDQAYVSLAYMTGVLPIQLYHSGSGLNMFLEYTMTDEMFGTSFGFTQLEVNELYKKYEGEMEKQHRMKEVSLELLKEWYDGYAAAVSVYTNLEEDGEKIQIYSTESIYNPRSVILSLKRNKVANYWVKTGPFDEIGWYINHNIDSVRDDIGALVLGETVQTDIGKFTAEAMELNNREEILSAMVVYGFLAFKDDYVYIPNRELMEEYKKILKNEESLGYINKLARESGKLLKATLEQDSAKIEEIMERTHDTESPLLSYSDENELTMVVAIAYIDARNCYDVVRQSKGGVGYVDFAFLPKRNSDDAFILELKVDDTPDAAIEQIKKRRYMELFDGKLGEQSKYTGRILAVGISYYRDNDIDNKKHHAKVEVLREKI